MLALFTYSHQPESLIRVTVRKQVLAFTEPVFKGISIRYSLKIRAT
jgi:hypothetical protein